MDIEIIREFVEFSKTLNFSKTARAINISQSAFSSHILKLEKDLDAKLIDRGRQSNVLTGEGKLFLEYATSIVGSYDDAKSKLKQLHSGNQNVVRVHKAIFWQNHATISTASSTLLAKRIPTSLFGMSQTT